MSRRGGERPTLTRTLWILNGLIVAALLGLAFAVVVVHDRQERCVQAVLRAQHVGLSTWEAVASCQRREP